jgi:hypothetical protein
MTGIAVAAAAHGDGEPVFPREADRHCDVVPTAAADDRRRARVEAAVPDRAGQIVSVIARHEYLSSDAIAEDSGFRVF